jgi:hypothetical protein
MFKQILVRLPSAKFYVNSVRFEVLTAVTVKNDVFSDVTPGRSCVKRRFCGHLLTMFSRSRIFSTLKIEAIRSSETSDHTRSTRRHITEDGILHVNAVSHS